MKHVITGVLAIALWALGYFFGFLSGVSSKKEIPEHICPVCPEASCIVETVETAACLKDKRELLQEVIARAGSENRALNMVASCCMVDDIYPEQCIDPRCESKRSTK
jgi:hypothetical protein